jgi:hypothetical protein
MWDYYQNNSARGMPVKLLAETLANMAKHKIRKHCLKFYPVKLTDKPFFKVVTHQNIYDLPPFLDQTKKIK